MVYHKNTIPIEPRPSSDDILVDHTHINRMPESYRRVLKTLASIIQRTQAPELRFSERGLELREQAEQLYEKFLKLRSEEDERVVLYNNYTEILLIRFEQLQKERAESGNRLIETDANPLLQILDVGVSQRLRRLLKRAIDSETEEDKTKEVSFIFPPEATKTLEAGFGVFSANIETYQTPSGDWKCKISFNEVWDHSTRFEPVVSVIFEKLPQLVKSAAAFVHHHDDDRFQFRFSMTELEPRDVVHIFKQLAREAWASRPGHGKSEDYDSYKGPFIYLARVQKLVPQLQLDVWGKI